MYGSGGCTTLAPDAARHMTKTCRSHGGHVETSGAVTLTASPRSRQVIVKQARSGRGTVVA